MSDTTPKAGPPREFWLTNVHDDLEATVYLENPGFDWAIHVIEKSAYDAVVADRDSWKISHNALQDAANEHIERLTKERDAVVAERDAALKQVDDLHIVYGKDCSDLHASDQREIDRLTKDRDAALAQCQALAGILGAYEKYDEVERRQFSPAKEILGEYRAWLAGRGGEK